MEVAMTIDQELRTTRMCSALTALAWCAEQNAEIQFWDGRVTVVAMDGRRAVSDSLVAAVLKCTAPQEVRA